MGEDNVNMKNNNLNNSKQFGQSLPGSRPMSRDMTTQRQNSGTNTRCTTSDGNRPFIPSQTISSQTNMNMNMNKSSFSFNSNNNNNQNEIPFTLDKRCMTCSGQSAIVHQAFKMACIA